MIPTIDLPAGEPRLGAEFGIRQHVMREDHHSKADGRSEFARAYGLASHIMAGCIVLVLPIGVGFMLDQRLHPGGVYYYSLIGLAIGLVGGGWYMWSILRPMLKEMMEPPRGPFRPYDDSDWNDDSPADDDNPQ